MGGVDFTALLPSVLPSRCFALHGSLTPIDDHRPPVMPSLDSWAEWSGFGGLSYLLRVPLHRSDEVLYTYSQH